MPFYNGEFGFADLYVTRGGADHVQPVHRILFFINAILFDLNLRYEAVLGAVFVVLIAVIMCLHFVRSHNIDSIPQGVAVGMIVMVVLIFSLNSTNIYTWSLVALGYMPIFLNIGFFSAFPCILFYRGMLQAHLVD